MIFITKIAKLMGLETDPSAASSKPDDDTENPNKGRDFSVLWLVRKMVREAHHEVINNSKVTIKVSPSLIVSQTLVQPFTDLVTALILILCYAFRVNRKL